MHFSYIKPSPIKNNECNLRDVREIQIITPYKVQYCGGCSVHWGDNISTVGGSFSTVEVTQCSGG